MRRPDWQYSDADEDTISVFLTKGSVISGVQARESYTGNTVTVMMGSQRLREMARWILDNVEELTPPEGGA